MDARCHHDPGRESPRDIQMKGPVYQATDPTNINRPTTNEYINKSTNNSINEGPAKSATTHGVFEHFNRKYFSISSHIRVVGRGLKDL